MNIDKYNSLLWELLPENGGKSSYLYGTIHLPENELFFRINEVKSLILECDTFMAEYPLNLTVFSDQEPFVLEDGKSWQDYLTIKQIIKVRSQLIKSFGLDIHKLIHFKPVVLEQLLAESMVRVHVGTPIDMQLWKFASENDLNVTGAETLESQLEIMSKFTLDQQFKNLLRIASNPSKYRREVNKLIQYYLSENIRGMYKTSIRSLGKMKHMLVYTRNNNIVESIQAEMGKNRVFCAVGAGHFYGEKGMLRILKHKGIKVSPIYSK